MANAKELKFQFVLDDQSFQRVKRALGELTTEAQKFAKAMQGAGGGNSLFSGGTVGSKLTSAQSQNQSRVQQKTNIGSAILGDVEAFQKLAKSGKEGMAAMTDAVRKGVREQMAEIDRLENKLARLHTRLQKDPRAAYEGAFRDRLQAQMLIRQGQLNTANERLGDLRNLQGGLQPPPTASLAGKAAKGLAGFLTKDLTGGLGPRGFAESAFESVVGPGLAGTIARSVGMAVAGAVKIVNTSVAADRMGDNLYAQQGRSFSPFIDAYKNRDASVLGRLGNVKAVLGDKQAAMQALSGVFGTDAEAQRWIQGATQTLAGDFEGSGLTHIARDSKGAEALAALVNNIDVSAPYRLGRGRAEEFLAATREERLAASQVAGRGFFLNPKTGKVEDSFTPWKADLHKRGFSTGQALSGGLASAHGAGSWALGGDIMSATAAGWGEYGNVLTAAARMGGTPQARGLAQLALGGGLNRGAGIQLAQGVIGTGFDPRGTTGMAGVLGAFQGGYGHMLGKNADPALQFNAVNQFLAGLQTGSATTMGTTSPFQQGMNVLGAVANMPGGSAYHQDLLAGRFDMKQMLAGASGTLTGTMADVARLTGMNQKTFQNQLDSSFGGGLDMWVDQGGNDAVSRAMRKYRKSGKSITDFAKSASTDELKSLGIARSEMTGEDLEGSIGTMFALKGVGYKGKKGLAPAAGRPDTPESQTRENEAKAMLDSASAVTEHLPTIVNDLLRIRNAQEQSLTTLNGLLSIAGKQSGLSDSEVQTLKESSTKKAVNNMVDYIFGPRQSDEAPAESITFE